jgi:hypothetical protein
MDDGLKEREDDGTFVNEFFRVSDPDPYWIRIQSGQWIRIRIRNPDPDPGGQK